MSEEIDIDKVSIDELLIYLSRFCHEGVELSGGQQDNSWSCAVCSTSSNQFGIDPNNHELFDDAYFKFKGYNTPLDAAKALYRTLKARGMNGC